MVRRKKITRLAIFFLLLNFVLVGCNQSLKEVSPEQKKELHKKTDSFLSDWHDAASNAHYENYFTKMDSISIFIGTDATENWPKKEFEDFSRPYFEKGKAWSFTAIERNIYSNDDGSIIWFDELLSTWMGICRGSGVVENKNNQLKIKHYVLSVTVPNDNIQGLIKLKKETDSILTKQITKKSL